MASKKQFIVIAIYHIKRNGATIYRVRSNQPNKKGRVEGTDQEERNGLWYDAHNVTVCNGRVSGCTCKGSEFRGKCYHRDGVQVLENARFAARKAVKVSKHQDKLPAQEVVSPEPTECTIRPASRPASFDKTDAEPVQIKPQKRDMLSAPLNRQGFSLLKVS